MTFALPAFPGLHIPARNPRRFSSIDLACPTNSHFVGIGTVRKPVSRHKPGKIRINGNRWSALNANAGTIQTGESIRVVGRQGLTLYVEVAHHS